MGKIINYINKLTIRDIFDVFFFIFVFFISALSVLFFLDLLNFYRLISFLSIEKLAVIVYFLNKIDVREIILYFWLLNFFILPVWFYFLWKRRNDNNRSLVKILHKQEDPEKLLAYMISDGWGVIVWVGELFQQIFRIDKKTQGSNSNFLEILLASNDIEVDANAIDLIQSQLKLKTSGVLDLPIKLGSQSSVFRLSFMRIDKNYIWQVMLLNQNYSINSHLFSRDIAEKLPVPIAIVGTRGETLFANDLLYKIFKLDRTKNEKVNFSDFIVKKEEDSVFAANYILDDTMKIDRCLFRDTAGEEFGGYLLQSIFYKKNSSGLRYIRTVVLLDFVSNAADKEVGVVDINPYVGYLEEIYNKAPFGIMVVEDGYKLLKTNETLHELLHLDLSQNASFADVFTKNHQHLINEINRGVRDLEFEYVIDGDRKLFKLVIFLLENSRKIIYVMDITHAKNLEAQVKLSQGLQTVGQIASVVAHDFNNLLTAIMSFTYFLQERNDSDDPSMIELEHIQQNANRAKVMIKQLLTFSRKQELSPQLFNVNSEISDLMSTVVRLIGDRITSEFIRGKNVGSIMMDKVQFYQVITNLVVNAKDAMKSGGKLAILTKSITLRTAQEGVLGTIPAGDYVLIVIKDEGEGIRKENIKLIFQSHFSTKGNKGNGLGLSTVLRIVHDSAGFIDVESTLDKGSSFLLYFPLGEQDSINKGMDSSYQVESTGKETKEIIKDLTGNDTVLLVEDETPVRMVCARLLKSKGYSVIEADGGEKALEMVKHLKHLPLVISDVMMPGMGGPEFISKLRDYFPDIKVIMMSGYSEDILEDIDGDISLKGIEFLAKPFTPDAFATKVKTVLSKE